MNLKRFALAAVALCALAATAPAQLAWEQTEVELHPKAGDEEAVATFKYTNKGKTPVKFVNVKSSCGCTVPAMKKNEAAPGESGEIQAVFKIGGRTGTQVKSVRVETDDAAQPVTNLILKAVISQGVELQPAFVYWEGGEAAKPKTITVKADKDVNVTKVDVSSSSPDFTTKVDRGSAPGEFVISVQPRDTSKPLNTTLTIKPDYPKVLYANARVTGPAAAGR